jgi:hypothetical protein
MLQNDPYVKLYIMADTNQIPTSPLNISAIQ